MVDELLSTVWEDSMARAVVAAEHSAVAAAAVVHLEWTPVAAELSSVTDERLRKMFVPVAVAAGSSLVVVVILAFDCATLTIADPIPRVD